MCPRVAIVGRGMLAKFYLSVEIIQSFLSHILLVGQLGQSGVESVKLSLKHKCWLGAGGENDSHQPADCGSLSSSLKSGIPDLEPLSQASFSPACQEWYW